MNKSLRFLIGLYILINFSGCGFKAGGAHPYSDGKVFLEEHGYSQSVIDAVINLKPLNHQLVVELSKSKSADVRFLVGKNPNLSSEEIDIFMDDKNGYARSGTAYNTNLTDAQMQRLFNDPSHTVFSNLARNPTVPREMLLRLHSERKPGLVFFAMNPNCPVEIQDEIKRSDDDLAKHWLQITEKRKESKSKDSSNPK